MKICSFVKVGTGLFGGWNTDGAYSYAKFGILTGAKKHHLEIGIGASVKFPSFGYSDDPLGYPFAGNIGWRIQQPNKRFIFRLGIGLPETLYTGVGFAF